MNFIDYCISTKNFSALNAVNEYTKSFGILDRIAGIKNTLKKRGGYNSLGSVLKDLGGAYRTLKDTAAKKKALNELRRNLGSDSDARKMIDAAFYDNGKKGYTDNFYKVIGSNGGARDLSIVTRGAAKRKAYDEGKRDAFDKVERDAAKKRKKDDYVDPLTLSLAERLAKVDPHKLNDFQTEKKYGGDARSASSKTKLSTHIPNLNAHKPSDQKVNAEFRKAMMEHPELFGGVYNSVPEFNKSYNKKVAED